MNAHQLIVFRTVVETGSFAKAAAEPHPDQFAAGYRFKAQCRSDPLLSQLPMLYSKPRRCESFPIEEGEGRIWLRPISR